MERNWIAVALLACAALAGCDRTSADKPTPPAAGQAGAQDAGRGTPAHRAGGVGKIASVEVTTDGWGDTPGAALTDALRNAVMQVNGVALDASVTEANGYAAIGAEIQSGWDGATLTTTVNAEAIERRVETVSNGMVSRFSMVSLTNPPKKGEPYKMKIKASIAQFMEPVDRGRLRIAVAPLRSGRTWFDIAGKSVAAAEALAQTRRAIIDRLAQSDRFVVLDREFDDELRGELGLITSGQSPSANLAKLGQAMSADVLLVGEVDRFEWRRAGDGGSYQYRWEMSQRLINLATREINNSATLSGNGSRSGAADPGAGDPQSALRSMQTELAQNAAMAVLRQFFPVAVVELNGMNVVLSQGAATLKEDATYRLYLQGRQIKDPHTGQSLGRAETLCCEVRVSRVADSLGYGALTGLQIDLANVRAGDLVLREAVAPVMPAARAGTATAAKVRRAADRTRLPWPGQGEGEGEGNVKAPSREGDW